MMSDMVPCSPESFNPEWNEIVEKIKQLMLQDKETVLLYAVSLITELHQQFKRNEVLLKTVKNTMEAKEILQRNVIDENIIMSHIEEISEKTAPMEDALSKKHQAISAKCAAIDTIRAQLKQDSKSTRAMLDVMSKHIGSLDEKYKCLHQDYETNLKRMNDIHKELDTLQLKHSKALTDNVVVAKERHELQEKYNSMVARIQLTLAEKDNERKQREQVLEKEKQQLVARNCDSEREIAVLKQRIVDLETQYDKRNTICDEKVSALEDKVLGLEGEKKALQLDIRNLEEQIARKSQEMKSRSDNKQSNHNIVHPSENRNYVVPAEIRPTSIKGTGSRSSEGKNKPNNEEVNANIFTVPAVARRTFTNQTESRSDERQNNPINSGSTASKFIIPTGIRHQFFKQSDIFLAERQNNATNVQHAASDSPFPTDVRRPFVRETESRSDERQSNPTTDKPTASLTVAPTTVRLPCSKHQQFNRAPSRSSFDLDLEHSFHYDNAADVPGISRMLTARQKE